MVLNFDDLSRPKRHSASIDPFEIFAKTPNLPNVPNDLWKGQAEALSLWHANRAKEDNLILLNTGAGKSIVGVLIAQSLVNENIGPVLFVCSTIDLVEQTARECARLGLQFTKRISGAFSNDLFETGKAFCITTYQALFVSNTTFKNLLSPAAIVFDDAHVGERAIRDAFTLSIEKQRHPRLFSEVIEIVRPEFSAIGKGPHLSAVLEESGQNVVTMCPPATAFRHREEIIEAIKRVKDWRSTDLMFPAIRLWEHIGTCAIFISSNGIEITPPFIPTGVYKFLTKDTRRIYLSATMEFETDFVRGFGRRIKNSIAPDNDAGNGERLILLASRFADSANKKSVAVEILKHGKLLISVPTYKKAMDWNALGQPPSRDNFSADLQKFRESTNGTFILVSRIDGIDLPQDTCRIMLIDGAPSGYSMMERYQFSTLSLVNLFSTKMAARITQLFGRINRGRSDYSAFVIYGRDINIWLKTERNVALLPSLIRKQIILSQTVQDGLGKPESQEVVATISQVLGRDAGWLNFYRETVDGLEVSVEALDKVKARETQLAASAEAECKFMTRWWQGDIEGARRTLLDILDATAVVDARLAGWYSVWLGATYDIEGDERTSIAHYKKARSRLSYWLNVPMKEDTNYGQEDSGSQMTLKGHLLSVNGDGPQALGNLVAKLRVCAKTLLDASASANEKEEALRTYGEMLGFSSSRPDNDFGHGPDVVWKDEASKSLLAFELKTEKESPAEYSKSEVGQAHNHLQWIKDNEPSYMSNGLIIVGPAGICRSDASPSDLVFLVETSELSDRLNNFAAKVSDTLGRTSMERWALLGELGSSPEWQIPGWFAALATRSMQSIKLS